LAARRFLALAKRPARRGSLEPVGSILVRVLAQLEVTGCVPKGLANPDGPGVRFNSSVLRQRVA